ncbi:MAG: hypothetical protein RLZ98_2972 [Pseudomonadota bacterium]|jgi:phthalate 4,5-dioxygenase reductase subunit
MTEVTEAPSMRLLITTKSEIAEGIFGFELVRPDGGELPEFTAGAHLDIVVPNGETRKYSLCGEPADLSRYQIAVKREDGGKGGSKSLCDEANAGDTLEVSPPRNDFGLAPRVQNFLFIAGGIGITPILSMMHHLDATGAAKYKLVYLARSPAMTAFLDELKAPKYRGKVTIHHDEGDPDRFFDLWPLLEQQQARHVYCCGPRPLMEEVRAMTGHWSNVAVHFEDFGAEAGKPKPDDKPFRVRLARSGTVIEVPVGVTIMEAMRAAGLRVASSCESGTCGTCKTRLLAGVPDHRDLALAEFERHDHIMLCVSRALSEEIEIDA